MLRRWSCWASTRKSYRRCWRSSARKTTPWQCTSGSRRRAADTLVVAFRGIVDSGEKPLGFKTSWLESGFGGCFGGGVVGPRRGKATGAVGGVPHGKQRHGSVLPVAGRGRLIHWW